MAQAVDEVFAELLSMAVLAVTVDVIERNLIKAVRAASGDSHSGFHCCQRCFLSAQYNVINLALTSSETPVNRNRARDIRGIVAVFGADIHHHKIPGVHLREIFCVMQNSRIEPRTHDWVKCQAAAALALEGILQQRTNLVLENIRAHPTLGRFKTADRAVNRTLN